MPKILNKYAVRHILDNLNEIEVYLAMTEKPDDLYVKFTLINVAGIRREIMWALEDEIEIEAPEKVAVNEP